jgi:tRNA A58 N-methylase Trm61
MSQNNYSEFLNNLVKWQGYLTLNEVSALQQYSAAISTYLKPVIVNIGAGAGTSTIALASGNNNATIFSVDIRADELEMFTNEHLRMKEVGEEISDRVIRIWGDSKKVGYAFPYKVDLVFIDGDHSYDGILGDIGAWSKNIWPGGIICFHDYGSNNWPSVKNVVDKYASLSDWTQLCVIDTLAVYRTKHGLTTNKVEYASSNNG